MHNALIVTIGVVVAAFIGGMTNYLAIKMLFRPRAPWFILGRRVPFTPGLIPKRRDEIAASLGKVVAEYLVTSNGLAELLRKESFRESLVRKAEAQIRRLAETEETIEGYISRIIPEHSREMWMARLTAALKEFVRKGLSWFWTEQGGSSKQIGQLLPIFTEERKDELSKLAANYLAETVRNYLYTPEGERWLLKMTTQLLDQAGGFLGAMASIFMDEHKLAGKVRQALGEALSGSAARLPLQQLIWGQIDKLELLTIGEAASLLAGEMEQNADVWIDRVTEMLDWENVIGRIGSLRVDEFVTERQDWIMSKLPDLVDGAAQIAEKHVDKIFAAVKLEELVEKQVQDFPIERIEQIILSLSGREFRAITWLGALLGGVIGLMQSILLQLLG